MGKRKFDWKSNRTTSKRYKERLHTQSSTDHSPSSASQAQENDSSEISGFMFDPSTKRYYRRPPEYEPTNPIPNNITKLYEPDKCNTPDLHCSNYDYNVACLPRDREVGRYGQHKLKRMVENSLLSSRGGYEVEHIDLGELYNELVTINDMVAAHDGTIYVCYRDEIGHAITRGVHLQLVHSPNSSEKPWPAICSWKYTQYSYPIQSSVSQPRCLAPLTLPESGITLMLEIQNLSNGNSIFKSDLLNRARRQRGLNLRMEFDDIAFCIATSPARGIAVVGLSSRAELFRLGGTATPHPAWHTPSETVSSNEKSVLSVCFMEERDLLFLGLRGGSIMCRNMNELDDIVMQLNQNATCWMSPHPINQRFLFSCSFSGEAILWDVNSRKAIMQYKGLVNTHSHLSIVVSLCGKFIFAAQEDGSIGAWCVDSGQKLFNRQPDLINDQQNDSEINGNRITKIAYFESKPSSANNLLCLPSPPVLLAAVDRYIYVLKLF